MRAAFAVAAAFRDALVPFLEVSSFLLILMLAILLGQRFVLSGIHWRRRRLARRYQSAVADVIMGDARAVRALALAPRRHRGVIAELLLGQIRVLTGESIARARTVAQATRLDTFWREALDDRRWWRRAEASRALGLIADPESFARLAQRLDDPHEEVRAAAAEALGRLGDARAVPPLIDRLSEQSRHQRVRIAEALRELGQRAGGELLAFVRAQPDRLPVVADILAVTAGAAAEADLMTWSSAEDPQVRAAAIGALGSIGLDARGFYYALRALEDDHAAVRAMAARALGRSGREDAAAYLEPKLNDEWSVAAHSARGLAQLSSAGRAALLRHAHDAGQPGDLAKQMLWETGVAVA
ncbi:MAG TPA: HEAT repeat domain-containing protein [Vicinamibacterales bacterium]|nr:HEAT repeat domain-containing protein [Vicinamibacterales bacterium]